MTTASAHLQRELAAVVRRMIDEGQTGPVATMRRTMRAKGLDHCGKCRRWYENDCDCEVTG